MSTKPGSEEGGDGWTAILEDDQDVGTTKVELDDDQTAQSDAGVTNESEEDDEPQRRNFQPENQEKPRKKNSAQDRIRELANRNREQQGFLQQRDTEILKLREELANRDKAATNTAISNATVMEENLKARVADLQKQYARALNEGDNDTAANINSELMSATVDLKGLNAYKIQQNARKQQLDKPPAAKPAAQPATQSGDYPPEALAWVENHRDWWGVDKERTAAAFRFEKILRADGMNPEDPKFYEELDTLLETKFGRSEAKPTQQKRESFGISGGSRPSSKGVVRIKRSEFEDAQRKYGFKDVQEYARYKRNAEASLEQGGYSTLER